MKKSLASIAIVFTLLIGQLLMVVPSAQAQTPTNTATPGLATGTAQPNKLFLAPALDLAFYINKPAGSWSNAMDFTPRNPCPSGAELVAFIIKFSVGGTPDSNGHNNFDLYLDGANNNSVFYNFPLPPSYELIENSGASTAAKGGFSTIRARIDNDIKPYSYLRVAAYSAGTFMNPHSQSIGAGIGAGAGQNINGFFYDIEGVCYGLGNTPPNIECNDLVEIYPGNLGNPLGPNSAWGDRPDQKINFKLTYTPISLQPGDHDMTIHLDAIISPGQTLKLTINQYNISNTQISNDVVSLTGNKSITNPSDSIQITAHNGINKIELIFSDSLNTAINRVQLSFTFSMKCKDLLGGKGDYLCDSEMDQLPTSNCWVNIYSGYDTHWANGGANYIDGRLSNGFFTTMVNGNPACGQGFHAVGVVKQFLGGNSPASPIDQGFTWDGGTLYWKIMARGTWGGLLPIDDNKQSRAMVYFFDNEGLRHTLIDNAQLSSEWQVFQDSLLLPEGHYTLYLDRGEIADSNENDSVYYDNAFISNAPIPVGCNNLDDWNKTTATPQPTPTAGNGGSTNTPGPSPTTSPEEIDITNCSFAAGWNGWGHNNISDLHFDGAPVGPSYARAKGNAPSIWQSFFLSQSRSMLVRFWTRKDYSVQMTNVNTKAIIPVKSGWTDGWIQITSQIYLPPGSYQIELNTTISASYADYNGIQVSSNSLSPYGCGATPTPGPSPYWTLTPSPTGPTSTPTKSPTPWNWHGTNTPIPSQTWNPNQTQAWQGTATSNAATATKNNDSTATAISVGTATMQGTPLPNGTQTKSAGSTATANYIGTSTAQGTPYGPGGTQIASTTTPCPWCDPNYGTPQPPPASDAACVQPSQWEWYKVVGWVDFEVCRSLSFASWGSTNTSQAVEIPNMFANKEPFSSIDQARTAMDQIKGRIAEYDWSGSMQNDAASANDAALYTQNGNNPNSPYAGGAISIMPGGATQYSTICNTALSNSLGEKMRPGVCFVFNIFHALGLLAWVQTLVNVSSLVALIFYIKSNWINGNM
jgi:hypothetical protein